MLVLLEEGHPAYECSMRLPNEAHSKPGGAQGNVREVASPFASTSSSTATTPIGPGQRNPATASGFTGGLRRVEEYHIYDSEDDHFAGSWVLKI